MDSSTYKKICSIIRTLHGLVVDGDFSPYAEAVFLDICAMLVDLL